ncbi:zinc-finger of mitochondrial splicing suppressor 51-domain-containing protein [Desarmillaria tabescens]|uniref:Zinc-finger of mitochondrial splicing suppressor 51-domain-containing protein n=1 Tax=Armillaria tabescens TaxID=1929756 RepID=A0AA39KEI9_ARMTA|nr:zinc-finger of mitochondrial splicing suppressor 51-domain-containing protein [Desarmillaria tabescens]KAK0458441.1 zinc-finger of mitochondrial splicing suppressor 51-domain-containing protein [Desarmillaria tabescens]
MAFTLACRRSTPRLLTSIGPAYSTSIVQAAPRRHFFNFFRRSKKKTGHVPPPDPIPILTEDNLFHPFSKSPIPAVRARGEVIQSMSPCPVCSSQDRDTHVHIEAQPKTVQFECPDCGWPTHCSEEHWKEDKEHEKYCSRLREANEDEHDLRSGRKMWEFEMPGPQGYEEAVSFSNWDIFWYTRGFPSMDTERSRRHASKLLSYPMTIGSVLHQHSSLMLNNQRLTPEGSRSMAAIRSTLHTPTGAPETQEATVGKPQVRIFILGARAESSLPPHVWEQLGFLFPAANFQLLFIGPQVSLPKDIQNPPNPKSEESAPASETYTPSDAKSEDATPSSEASTRAQGTPRRWPSKEEEKPLYVPNIYQPPVPAPIVPHKRTRASLNRYNVPSYTTPYTYQMTLTGLQTNYKDVHPLFEETLDPYSDCFFFFSPGFGFPSQTSMDENGEPLLQISSPTEWGPVLPMLLASKCPIFVTGFSPADVERDIKSLSTAPGVAGEFDEKWEVADFDPRVMVKTNWGIWAIRGKSRDIQERSFFSRLFEK